MSHARYLVGDVFERMAELPDGSVDLLMTSPPFLALRSYLPADHPDKHREIGSEATPAAFLDTLLALTAEWRRLLAPHGSICVELGDTYAGSGGAGGDYGQDGIREGQPTWTPQHARTAVSDYHPDLGSDAATNAPSGSPRNSTESRAGVDAKNRGNTSRGTSAGNGWPLAKSLCAIPQLYEASLAYGRNLLTGAESPAGQWRVRNMVAWCRPNPPVGALGDKFRPATSYLTIACVSDRRYFDLDATRQPVQHPNVSFSRDNENLASTNNRKGTFGAYNAKTSAGAPPLDWWNIPTHPYLTPSGTLVVPAAGTFHQVRVPVGAGGDGIQRTTSPDCPVHGSPDHPGSSAPDDERGDDASSHNARSNARPAREPAGDSPPTPLNTGQMVLGEDPADHAAKPHSKPSSRTGPASATSPADTPSARTARRIVDIPTGLALSAPRPDTPSSRTAEACQPAVELETPSRTVDTSDPSSACTCPHYVEVSIASESTWDYATWPDDHWELPTHGFPGAHYATFPAALCVKPILAMCPQRVCTTCGEPSTRIVGEAEYVNPDGSDAAARLASVPDKRHVNAHEVTGRDSGNMTRSAPTLGWSDCQHGTWRNGLVLDPFAGSGTTLAVASGHGRDSIGIDLDPRGADLARERVGMFLEVETSPAGGV